MPNHRSAEKSVRNSERRRIINRNRKGMLKSSIKNVLMAVEEKDVEKAEETFRSAISVIDKMVVKGLIHKNNAARKKSRLWHKVSSVSSTVSPE